jgi:hypothetical protein
MAYTSPHSVRHFLGAACLRIVHDYVVRCQRRSNTDKKGLLRETREIDLCAKMADFFGPVAHLAAQGIAAHVGPDLEIDGPTIRAEIKYFRPPARNWNNLVQDWEWLLNTTNNGDEFKKRAWVIFWPSVASNMFTFTNCLSVAKSHNTQYSLLDFAPFAPYAEPEMPENGDNQRLAFKDAEPSTLLMMPHGKRIRVDIIGSPTHPLWAAVYTRTAPADVNRLRHLSRIHINEDPIII